MLGRIAQYLTIYLLCWSSTCYCLQTEDAAGAFDVTSVKLSDPNATTVRLQVDPADVVMNGVTLKFLITYAYSLFDFQISGGPTWLSKTNFAVEGKMDPPDSPPSSSPNPVLPVSDGSTPLLQQRLKRLLAERFKLVTHVEQREMPAYSLVVGTAGPKIELSSKDEGLITGIRYLKASHISMKELASLLATAVGRPVSDSTKLNGAYRLSLAWGDPESDPHSDQPGLFSALQEQLGLKLIPNKQLVPIMLIDHAELPSPN